MLTVRDLVIRYGPVDVVRSVGLQVDEGEIVALLGPNGSGKSTVVRAISGLLQPAAGSILFRGRRIDHLAPNEIVKLGIAHITQGHEIFPNLSIEDNLLLGAYIRRDRRVVGQDLEAIYKRWPLLYSRRKEPAGLLSGGQQQILAIAQALMSRPRLLVLDEPSSGLAPALVSQVLQLIQELRTDGLTILLVEQLVDAALSVADRAYVLSRGEVALSGRAADLRNDPNLHSIFLGRA